jgi:NAD(P)-dependent dehydrogenase (short-subunit alcohol dehydrogenase family)
MGQLQGKVAIITGAGSGFGEGMAAAYVREGAKIIIADLNAEAGERVAKALGANAKAVACDVANADSTPVILAEARRRSGAPIVRMTRVEGPLRTVDTREGCARHDWSGAATSPFMNRAGREPVRLTLSVTLRDSPKFGRHAYRSSPARVLGAPNGGSRRGALCADLKNNRDNSLPPPILQLRFTV